MPTGGCAPPLVVFTGASLAIQLIPVAPPRMLPRTGLVDTGVLYHQSAYASVGGFNADQLSAMPSVHVGWAILVATAVIGTARSRWRWLAVLYPVLTTLAVVVTANHFWLDGIVAGLLLGLVLAVQAAGRRALGGRAGGRRRAALSAPGPAGPAGPAGPQGPPAVAGSPDSGLYRERLTWDDSGDKYPIGTRW